jgi:hypothetical protein
LSKSLLLVLVMLMLILVLVVVVLVVLVVPSIIHFISRLVLIKSLLSYLLDDISDIAE